MKAHTKQAGSTGNWQKWLLITIAGALSLLLLLLPLHAFFSTWLGTSVGPLLLWKSWKELLLLLLIPVLTALCLLNVEIVRILWRRPVNKIIAIYTLLHLVLSLFSSASLDAVLAGLAMNLRFLAVFVLAQIVALYSSPWLTWLKAITPTWLLITIIGLGVLAILQVMVLPKDFLTHFGYNRDTTISPFLLVDENPDALRAFATMRGPNTLGAYLLIPLAVALYFVVQKRKLWLSGSALGFGLMALLLTGSRSAWLGFVVMCVVLALLWLPREKIKNIFRWGIVPLIAGIILFAIAAVNMPVLRLAIFHSSPGDTSLFEGSSEKHWQAAVDGTASILEHPFGQGVGSAGPASFYNTNALPNISENYFVQIGQEVGIIGIVLFILICYLVVRQLLSKKEVMASLLLASFAGLTFINLLLHGWADDPTAITWWALAGLFIASPLPIRHNKEKRL